MTLELKIAEYRKAGAASANRGARRIAKIDPTDQENFNHKEFEWAWFAGYDMAKLGVKTNPDFRS